ncbi:MAG: hypothetical protein HPY62_08565 [Bacteroidales bacterium]|nr:hypothetical protein [Bacteroidales bacterium]
MKTLLEKLNYKNQPRIAVINPESYPDIMKEPQLKDVRIDTEIDQRYPYEFMILFVKNVNEVKKLVPLALHNLVDDGILWFCYPKKTSKRLSADIDRDHGWSVLNDYGFYGIRQVSVDDTWSALRFRHKKYIKSASSRFQN